MVEAAVWLVYEAWKLLRPVAERVVADTQQDAADWTEKKATRWVKRVITPADAVPRPLQADGGDVAAPDEAVGATDDAIVTALEQDPSTAEDLRQVAEGVLGVSLGGAGVVPGSDAWFVSAYEALLWRAAVMAGWEGRPIAVAGALQGPGWVTVCVPRRPLRPGEVIDPSSLWNTTSTPDVRRPSDGAPPADFFVRRIGEGENAAEAAAAINEWSTITHEFDPGSVGPGGEVWHRIDDLSRKWVRFRWDNTVKKYVQAMRSPARTLDGKSYLFPINLEVQPRYNPPNFRSFLRAGERRC